MVGRFNVRPGDGDSGWVVWDNAANGARGSGLSERDAIEQAADLELQYDAHGYRAPGTVRRVDPPVPVEAWHPAGVLDAWVRENGAWIGRVRERDGTFVWIRDTELRQVEDR